MRATGNLLGLRPPVLKQIDRLAERRAGVEAFVDPWFAVALQDAALEAGRRIGCLVGRRGGVQSVLVGDAVHLPVPKWARKRLGAGRLGGLRLIHATLSGQGLATDDLETLRMLSLDATVAVICGTAGAVPMVEAAHLVPDNAAGRLWEILPRRHATMMDARLDLTLRDLETQLRRDAANLRNRGFGDGRKARDAAIIVIPVLDRTVDEEWERAELTALCHTAGVAVAAVVVQRRSRPDPTFLVGRGKVREIAMLGLAKSADLLVFGSALTPSQQRSIAEATDVRVIDRNQLILDIFAKHAHTPEGKLQVELAQLRYNLPRLSEKDDALSRLTGGIGAQGPGETTLEMGRRAARQRITVLEKRIQSVVAERSERRRRRVETAIPMAAVVGYTNAGKSTLFNTLTGASVIARDRLFATLDPTVRRMRLEDDSVALLVDTVGFIRDLPDELVGAFRATLEEIDAAKVLVLVADASDPHLEDQVAAVQRILAELDFGNRPVLLVLNKADCVRDKVTLAARALELDGILTCATDPATLQPVLRKLTAMLAR